MDPDVQVRHAAKQRHASSKATPLGEIEALVTIPVR
jgi:hypothetical protein